MGLKWLLTMSSRNLWGEATAMAVRSVSGDAGRTAGHQLFSHPPEAVPE
jgi:hypothetical protein